MLRTSLLSALFSLLFLTLPARAFTHPGLLNSRQDYAFIQSQIRAAHEPWTTALKAIQSLPQASLDYTPKPRAAVDCGSASKPDLGCTDEKRDSEAAYLHALLFAVTGDARHAQKSAQILHAWSTTLKSHGLSNAHLEAGWTGAPFCRAAEILRSLDPAWTDAQTKEFTAMLDRAFLPNTALPQRSGTNGNWEASMIETTMSIAVFKDDQKLFDESVARFRRLLPAYVYGTEDGPAPKPIDPHFFNSPDKLLKHWYGQSKMFDGLCQETGRDLTHTQWGLGALLNCAEIADHQNLDLYGANNNRLLRAMEFHAPFLTGAPVPPDLHHGQLAGTHTICPTWETAYNHYHNREHLPMPHTETLLEKSRPQTGPDHHLAFDTLTHYQTADTQSEPPARTSTPAPK